jgi:DNA-directed RNA polymerase specialized sigma24 family protein
VVRDAAGEKMLVRDPASWPHKKMREIMRNLDEQFSDSWLSKEEVIDTLSNLKDTDWVRFKGLARLRATGLRNATADDLVSEAVKRILDGTRNWPRDLSAGQFFSGVIRSIASDWRDQQKKEAHINITLQHPAEDDIFATDAFDGSANEGRYDLSPERIVVARDALLEIQKMFEHDDNALAVILGRAEGMSPAETQKEFSMTATEYDSATRKIRRAFLKHETMRPQS